MIVVRTYSAALEYLQEFRPDGAIVYVNLGDGICSTVVDRLNYAGIPFLIHSSFEAPVEPGNGFRRGQWLSKPTNPDIIAAALQEILQRGELVTSVWPRKLADRSRPRPNGPERPLSNGQATFCFDPFGFADPSPSWVRSASVSTSSCRLASISVTASSRPS